MRELTAADHLRADRETVSWGPRRIDTDLAALAAFDRSDDAKAVAAVREGAIDDVTPELDERLRQERARLGALIIEQGLRTGQAALARGTADRRACLRTG